MAINLMKFFQKFPRITVGEYTMRECMFSDQEEYYSMMSDPRVVKFLSENDAVASVEEARAEIQFWAGLFYRKQSIFWAVANSADKLIGTIGYNSWSNESGRAEIAYDFHPDYWGRGIASKCVGAVIDFSFKEMGLYRVEARSMQGNSASHKLLERLGFKREGLLRGYRIIRGVREDIVLHSLVQPEFTLVLDKQPDIS